MLKKGQGILTMIIG